jgi:hypothetical protein
MGIDVSFLKLKQFVQAFLWENSWGKLLYILQFAYGKKHASHQEHGQEDESELIKKTSEFGNQPFFFMFE